MQIKTKHAESIGIQYEQKQEERMKPIHLKCLKDKSFRNNLGNMLGILIFPSLRQIAIGVCHFKLGLFEKFPRLA